jgi:hypothetical protein
MYTYVLIFRKFNIISDPPSKNVEFIFQNSVPSSPCSITHFLFIHSPSLLGTGKIPCTFVLNHVSEFVTYAMLFLLWPSTYLRTPLCLLLLLLLLLSFSLQTATQ